MIRFSIVTVCFNSEKTILKTIESIANQSFIDFEHVIIDGGSNDNTLEIIKSNSKYNLNLISEKDDGIYDAMNKGVNISKGQIIVFLNSDDFFASTEVLKIVNNTFLKNDSDIVYGNIQMINNKNKIIRKWNSSNSILKNKLIKQIPHPAFYVKTDIIKKLDYPFDRSFKIAADLKQQLILTNNFRLKSSYINEDLAIMRLGGTSTSGFAGYYLGWKESVQAYNDVFVKGGFNFTLKKVFKKVPDFFR